MSTNTIKLSDLFGDSGNVFPHEVIKTIAMQAYDNGGFCDGPDKLIDVPVGSVVVAYTHDCMDSLDWVIDTEQVECVLWKIAENVFICSDRNCDMSLMHPEDIYDLCGGFEITYWIIVGNTPKQDVFLNTVSCTTPTEQTISDQNDNTAPVLFL